MDQQQQNFEPFNDFSFANAFGSAENTYAAAAINQTNSSLYDQQYMQYNQPSIQEPTPTQEGDLKQQQPQFYSEQSSVSKQDTVTFDSSQNSMMKALGVVRKDILGAGSSNKKRKRIVVLNDDDSDEDPNSNLKNEILDKSNGEQDGCEEKNDASESDVQTDNEEGENLTDIGALKAKFLLKNAVIIQGPDKKKKKSRLLDSDDENQVQATSVDDIGIVNEDDNNDEELFESNILITEPIIPTIAPETFHEENKIEKADSFPAVETETAHESEIPKQSSEQISEIPSVANTESKISEEKNPAEKNDAPKTTDTESFQPQSAEETEIDPTMSVEAILENIKPMADDDEFFKFDKSSDENDKSIPNDEYFGTPDKQQQGQYKGKKRGPKPGSKRIPRDTSTSSTQQRRKRGDRYEEDFVDDSDESGSDSNFSDSSASTSESSDEERTEKRPRGRPPTIKKPPIAPVLIQSKNFTVTKVPIRNNIIKRDRFYDRSRDIPNDVYFGDVNVPLHVLHTRWNSDADSDDDWRCNRTTTIQTHRMSSSVPSSSKVHKHLRPQFTYIHDHTEEPKLSSLKEFIHLCGIKVNYQRLFDGIKSSDQKCAMLRRILAQKGMQGEPTVAKCKIIRRELQAKRESAELDKSVIITEGAGRTRRSRRNASKNASYTEDSDDVRHNTPVVQPETLQTLSKIRQVIDSDSD